MMRRRDFLRGASASAVGLLAHAPSVAGAEAPPETTRIRLPQIRAICVAPQVVAEDLLRAEGFTDVQYVRFQGPPMRANMKALAAGETDLAVTYTTNTVLQIDAGDACARSVIYAVGKSPCPSSVSVITPSCR